MEMEVSGLESAGDVELHELDLLVNSERKKKNSTGDLAREWQISGSRSMHRNQIKHARSITVLR
jgi:hypothetical protein